MSEELTTFMTELATNSEMQEAYKQDPKSLMEKHNLGEEDINLMLTGDVEAIQKKIGDDYKVSGKEWISAFKPK